MAGQEAESEPETGSVSGLLRRARRHADMSQREMAAAAGLPRSTLGAAEVGTRDLGVTALMRVIEVAGLRLALLDGDGREITPMSGSGVRDGGGRRFPAHLDTRYGDEDWWHGSERYSRTRPWYTFDRSRRTRDLWRGRTGVPADHQEPQPGDAPEQRRAARQRAARLRRQEEREQRLRSGVIWPLDDGWTCACPPACDELDDWSGRPVHAEECPCRCDIG